MISSLTPISVWTVFNQICQIPHPSHHEKAITQYIINFANTHNIEYQLDEVGNILLRKQATKGKEHTPSIALQAHMDMVPQKNEETEHNFLTDPIKPYIDGDWVKAKGTTLGADNGIGLASSLAILADNKLEHGPLEVLITASEETGMVGAFGLQPNWLKSRYLINTDSEDEGEIFIGCAGGIDFQSSIPLTYKNPSSHDVALHLSLKGLKGGHSGCDIHLDRGNAIKLMARFLSEYTKNIEIKLSSFQGGSLRNAIPREAFADIMIPKDQLSQFEISVKRYQTDLQKEFDGIEPNIILSISSLNQSMPTKIFTDECQIQILDWLNSLPNGVVKMTGKIVETSLNLGIVDINNDVISARFLIRSQIDSAKYAVVSSLISHSRLSNANYEIKGEYSGWTPNLNSSLLKLAEKKYQEIFNIKAKIMIIHAGLECGLFTKHYPDMDIISIGPTIRSPHSPDERVNIHTVEKYWMLLLSILKSASELS